MRKFTVFNLVFFPLKLWKIYSSKLFPQTEFKVFQLAYMNDICVSSVGNAI